jgi:Bardet-Biedl syndrome 4 protein
VELQTTLGLLFLDLGETRKAFDAFGSALTCDPRDHRAIMGVGSVLQESDDFDVALVKYRVSAGFF